MQFYPEQCHPSIGDVAGGESSGQMIELKTLGQTLICTEWLARTRGNLVGTNLPVFALAKVGCLNWGLVAGN